MNGDKGRQPIWRQIAATLAGEIGPGGLLPGARLPTEAQLSARFEVNRHTVRRAMEQLARTGLVRVEQGRGAFVADDVIPYRITGRTRFNEWIRRHNREPSGQTLLLRQIGASAEVAAGLGVGAGEGVVQFDRLGLADGVPVSLASHFFHEAGLPGILEALRGQPTITEALLAVGVADYQRRSTRVSARMPTVGEAGLLQVGRSRPLIVCENVNVDLVGRIVEFGLARYPGSRVEVVFEP